MNKIISIQALRGIAAVLVVFVHACHDIANLTTQSLLINFYNLQYFGYMGVDLFFVISGFIMILIHGNDFLKPKATSIFLIKRIIRVVPLYWIFTILSASLLFIVPEIFTKGKTFDLEHLIASLFFLPHHNSVGEIIPVLGVGWTLNFEMYFYMIFALTLLLPKKYFLGFISFILISGVLIFNIVNVSYPYFLMIGKPILLEFLFGVYIGCLYRKKTMLKNPIFWLVVALLFIVNNIFMHHDSAYRVIYDGIPSAILIYSLLSLEYEYGCKYCNRYFIILGSASYSIYITHAYFYKLTIKLYERLFGMTEPDLMILFSVFFSIIGGIVIYHILEKPMYDYMKIKYSNYLVVRGNPSFINNRSKK